MNPLLNEQLGHSTHREYEAKYGRQFASREEDHAQPAFPVWQKLAVATGGIATLIVLAGMFLAG